jgi:hypothetical protein
MAKVAVRLQIRRSMREQIKRWSETENIPGHLKFCLPD